MTTRILKVDALHGAYAIDEAAAHLIAGEVVAFPTETVYGLGCNALNPEAVDKVFAAKGRPSDNPLIVHIAEFDQLLPLVGFVPETAKVLADKFWPGPLTIVLPSSGITAKAVTAGLDTVAVRIPAHPTAREIISKCGLPVAAPSANRSGRPSPTSAEHVFEDLNGRIPLIIDGGKTDIGIESTVIDLTGKSTVILRPGGVTFEMLREIIKDVVIDEGVLKITDSERVALSPGMKHTHYAPRAEMIIVDGKLLAVIEKIKRMADGLSADGRKVGILATAETASEYSDKFVVLSPGSRRNPQEYAANLFAVLRRFDASKVDIIISESLNTNDEGLAIMNRMLKAAGFRIVSAD